MAPSQLEMDLPPASHMGILNQCDPQMPMNPPTPLPSMNYLPIELTPLVPLPMEQLSSYNAMSKILEDGVDGNIFDDSLPPSPLVLENPTGNGSPPTAPSDIGSPPPAASPNNLEAIDNPEGWNDESVEEILAEVGPAAASPNHLDGVDNSDGWNDESAEEILAKVGPAKSLKLYEKEWLKLSKFLKKDLTTYEPVESDYIRYFNFLRKAKKQKCSSLWTIASRLSNCHAVSYSSNCFQLIYMACDDLLFNYIFLAATLWRKSEEACKAYDDA